VAAQLEAAAPDSTVDPHAVAASTVAHHTVAAFTEAAAHMVAATGKQSRKI
jgi:hypothetical protein